MCQIVSCLGEIGDLEQFPRNPDDLHLPAWKGFYKNVKDSNVGF